MQLPIRPVTVLARPSDEALCWMPPCLGSENEDDFMAGFKGKECLMDKQFKVELCHQLSSWLGWAACAFASWEVICRTISSKQKDLVRHLNETMFELDFSSPNDTWQADCQVASLQPISINGCLGPLPEDAGDILSVGYLQRACKKHSGKQSAKVQDARRLAEFKLEGKTLKQQLEDFVVDAHSHGNVYLIVLDQRFFCQQDDSAGPLQWRSKTILLRLEMQLQTRMAVQLDFQAAEEQLQITGISLAGEELAHLRLSKEDAFGLLRDEVAKALGPTINFEYDLTRQHIDKLCMVLPDGTFASSDMDNKTMTEVVFA